MTARPPRRVAALAVTLLVAACGVGPDRGSGPAMLAITDVTLLDGRGGAQRPNVTIIVQGEAVAAVLPPGARALRQARRIDGGGGYLLPGFIDMHAHLLVPRCEPSEAPPNGFDRSLSERMLGMMLDFGITSIRSPGNPTVEGLALRDDLNAGRVRGPSARASAELISDPNLSEAQLRAYVRDALPHRPDYFKVYARLRPDAVATVIAEAHRHGVPVIGHAGATSWRVAARLGIDHLTHGADWSADMLPEARRASYAAATRERGAIRARIDWLEMLDLEAPEVRSTIDEIVKRGVTIDPTLVAYDSKFTDPSAARYRRNPFIDAIPELHADWLRCTTITRDWAQEDYDRWAAARPKLFALTRRMHDRGVRLTSGTDVTNPWVIPGESLHQEFELLAEAGIAPPDILRMSGEAAAHALGRDDIGIVEPGRRADLVLLSADPLTNIANSRAIRWVMQGGRIVSRGPLPGGGSESPLESEEARRY